MPAATVLPSGHTVGGGGGGGGQGCAAGICVPSAQVCIAGAGGVVAQAESVAATAKRSPVRLTFPLLPHGFGRITKRRGQRFANVRNGWEAATGPPVCIFAVLQRFSCVLSSGDA